MKFTQVTLGFTLTEFMLALLIGSFLLLGTMKMYITIMRHYSVTQQYTKLQEKMRTAYSILQDEINMAGNYACGQTEQFHNHLNQSEHDWWNTAFEYGVYGVDGSGDKHLSHQNDFHDASYWPQAIASQARKDSDFILLARMSTASSVAHLSQDGQLIQLKHPYDHDDVKNGSLWMICNIRDSVFFQSSGSQKTQQIPHRMSIKVAQADDHLSPGNQQSILDYNFTEGAQAGSMVANILFVAKSVSQHSYSLFREYLTFSNGKVSSRREELIVGIENLQFEYGLVNDDKDIDYYSALQVSAMAAWHEVVNVRVGVLFASEDNVLRNTGPQQFVIAQQQVSVEQDKRRRIVSYFVLRIKSR